MRRRLATVLLGAVAAAAFGVASAPSASACVDEQCPLGCRLLSQITGHPACPAIENLSASSATLVRAECAEEDCGLVCELWEALGKPICE